MKSKRNLMTVLVGLAMLATPIAAAAHSNDNYAHNNSRAAHVSRSSNAPARNVAPAVTRHEFHNNAAAANRDGRGANAYRNYGRNYGRNYVNPGYYGAPAYGAAAPYYGGGYAAGGSGCANAQRVMNNYYRDRNSGHPAAAYDLLRQNQWAFRSGCAGGSPATGGLLGGLGGYGGVPAYNNGGYNNGGYNRGGYNGGYGQPYGSGSTLAPLLQQFVR